MDNSLLTVADIMAVTTVSVEARETIAVATELLRRHRLPGVPVTEGDRVVGLLTPMHLLREPAYRRVAEVMQPVITPATRDLSLLQVHALMAHQDLEVLPVVEGGRIIGQVSLTAVLRAYGQQTDPLTGLPWATTLRAWASAALARGHEIAILFVDLDNFGAVNKVLGHTAGDDVLRAASHLLGSLVDVSTDLLCRYGGDEFAIATTRRQEEARALAQRVQETVVLPVETGGGPRYVTCSVGFAGGRRVEGRAPSHIAATVEDLLALASRASTAAKEAADRAPQRRGWMEARAAAARAAAFAPGVPAPEPRALPVEARLRLIEVAVRDEPAGCTSTVTLGIGARETTGRASGPLRERGALFLVAQATLASIARYLGEGHAYVIEGLTELPDETGKVVVVALSGGAGAPARLVGAARAQDLPHAVAKAVLDALNRVLARPLAEQLRRDAPP